MNTDQVLSLARSIFKVVGGMLVAHGLTTDSVMQDIVGALLTLVGVAWSFIEHKDDAPASTTAQTQ